MACYNNNPVYTWLSLMPWFLKPSIINEPDQLCYKKIKEKQTVFLYFLIFLDQFKMTH